MTGDISSSGPTGRFSLAGKTALIPGGYGEIGTAIATAFAEHGARVAVTGRDERKAHLADACARATARSVWRSMLPMSPPSRQP
jgi:NAD(P)-dependent dehydrogenase (short-subunit alcohol dehydrogenase family)